MPDPDVRENDVLVQVHAAAVDLLDSKIRNGELKLILPYRLPLILGNDVAGVVVRVGSRVRRFKPGDQVYARPPQDRIGSFAELISMNEDAVAIMPKKLTMEETASTKTGNHTYGNTLENLIRTSFFAQSSKTRCVAGQQSAPTRSQEPNSKPIDGPRPPQTPAASSKRPNRKCPGINVEPTPTTPAGTLPIES
jgi:hypothetical protein